MDSGFERVAAMVAAAEALPATPDAGMGVDAIPGSTPGLEALRRTVSLAGPHWDS